MLKFRPFKWLYFKTFSETYLCFSQLQRMCQVQSFGAHHILLPFEFRLQPFQLFGCENCAHSLGFSAEFSAGSFIWFLCSTWNHTQKMWYYGGYSPERYNSLEQNRYTTSTKSTNIMFILLCKYKIFDFYSIWHIFAVCGFFSISFCWPYKWPK